MSDIWSPNSKKNMHYTFAQRYEFYASWKKRTISHSFDAPIREILFLSLEHIFSPPCYRVIHPLMICARVHYYKFQTFQFNLIPRQPRYQGREDERTWERGWFPEATIRLANTSALGRHWFQITI